MKHRFLILPVAFLFFCAGCGVRKKMPAIDVQKTYQKKTHSQNNTLLIKSSSHSVVKASRAKNKEEISDSKTPEMPVSSGFVKERMVEIEARLGDVPVPLMVKAVTASDQGKGRYVMVYTTALPVVDLTRFYSQEMEYQGWTKVASFENKELLFSFKKQKQSCIVSVRPGKQSWWSNEPTTLHVYLQA